MQAKRPRVLVPGLLCLCGAWLAPTLALAEVKPAAAPAANSGSAAAKPAAAAPASAASTAKPAATPPASAASAAAKPAEAAPKAPAAKPAEAVPKAELVDSAAALAPSPDQSSSAAAPSPAVVTEAKQRFDRGLDLYSEGEYPLALIEFTRAYELVPNYRVLYNIAQVGIQLGQYANARRALEEYVQKGGDTLSADRRAGVTRDLEMLERRTAFIEIKVNVVGAEVLVDDVVVGKSPLSPSLLVDAGVHRISVRHSGYQLRVSRVTLAGGDRQALALTLDKQPENKSTIVVREQAAPKQDYKTLMIAGWVTTGALAAGAIVTGIMGAGEADELEQLKAADPADYDNLGARLDKTKSNASALFLASDVFSAGAVVVGGLSLWITVAPPGSSAPPSSEKPVPPSTARPMQVGFEANQFKLRGSF